MQARWSWGLELPETHFRNTDHVQVAPLPQAFWAPVCFRETLLAWMDFS